jgi:hypothetical protein
MRSIDIQIGAGNFFSGVTPNQDMLSSIERSERLDCEEEMEMSEEVEGPATASLFRRVGALPNPRLLKPRKQGNNSTGEVGARQYFYPIHTLTM